MFIRNQIANYMELSYEFMCAEDEATDSYIYGPCYITDLVAMYMGA